MEIETLYKYTLSLNNKREKELLMKIIEKVLVLDKHKNIARL